MEKQALISTLEQATKLSHKDCVVLNSILEDNFFLGRKNQEKIVAEITRQLEVSSERAADIYDITMSVIGTEIHTKLKHPFRSQN